MYKGNFNSPYFLYAIKVICIEQSYPERQQKKKKVREKGDELCKILVS